MANWANRLELSDLYKAKDKEEITVVDLGKEVAKRIRNTPPERPYIWKFQS
jgi:hypothetical protein